MHAPSSVTAGESGARPDVHLPLPELFQLSIYWFGINAVWGGLDGVILQERIPGLVDPSVGGRALALVKILAVLMAIVVQPTIGSISDYTMSRWGRRKPYIAIGATLDVVFLVGIASSQTYLSVVAFLILLQFSSNFAQGPFQGYIPDLVPARQVSLASALVGVMSVLGVVGGQALASVGYLLKDGAGNPDFTIPTISIGLIELATALGTLRWVREGRAPKSRSGRSWPAIAAETWGLDVLRERSFVWLVASRLCFLMGVGTVYNLSVLYLERSLQLTTPEKAFWVPVTSLVIGLSVLVSTVPASRLSDRVGRKRVIFGSCGLGAVGMTLLVVAPGVLVAEAGILLVAIGAGAFLAVDWALMSDIIPKESSGRFMGMSNVATASSGALALVVGGTLIDLVGGPTHAGSGPRVAFAVAISFYLLAAILLRPVDPRRRDDRLGDDSTAALVLPAAPVIAVVPD